MVSQVQGDSQEKKKFKRKSGQKSKFLQKAKKFGKQGKLGHGFQIDQDTYSYFLRVQELYQKDEFENADEKASFVTNSFEQTTGQEFNLSSNQMVSRVLEYMLPAANEEILERFCIAFTTSLRLVCTDAYASHVLEKLLEVISTKWTSNTTLTTWFRNTSKFILNNYEEYVFDNFSNRVMRKVFQCLTGTVDSSAKNDKSSPHAVIKSTKLPTAASKKDDESKINKENVATLIGFAQQFLNWPQFYDLFQKEVTSGVVQSLLQALKSVDEDLAFQGIVQTTKAISTLDLSDNIALHTLELCLVTGTSAAYHLIYTKYFKDKLLELAVHSKGNFTLRKLITAAPEKEVFENIYDTIEDKFGDILTADYTNIFVACAETCKRFSTRQSEFMKMLTALLKDTSSGEESFVEILARFNKTFKPKEDGTGTTFQTDINGTIVLQHMLDFHKPTKIVSNLLDMETRKLLQLTMDPKGSHIMDSLFKSSTVGDKRKEKMLSKLKDDLVTLACHKFGSRVLDSMWVWASITQKATIAAALSAMESKLNANQFGKFLSGKCNLHVYKKNPKQWEELEKGSGKKKAEIEEFKAAFVAPNKSDFNKIDAEEEVDELPRKKKKKKSKVGNDVAPEIKEEITEEVDEPPRKKKKSKVENDVAPEITEQITEEVDDDDPPRKKKKKKSKVENDVAPEIEEKNTEKEVDQSPKEKKKKKKSKVENNDSS